ncbi:MAG: hypothetical protein ACYCRD_10390 [Leptospirillum sp.]
MKRRKLSVEEWILIGRDIKEIQGRIADVENRLSGRIPKAIHRRIFGPVAKSPLEDEMFRQHPELGNEYTAVFYGDKLFPTREERDSNNCWLSDLYRGIHENHYR